jgi:hypothetical protein
MYASIDVEAGSRPVSIFFFGKNTNQ